MDLSIGVVSRLSRKGVFRCSLGNAGDIESDCCRSKPISILATRPGMDHVSQARRLHDDAPRDLSRDDPGLEILGQIRPGPLQQLGGDSQQNLQVLLFAFVPLTGVRGRKLERLAAAEIRSDFKTSIAAPAANEARLDIRQANIVRPAIGTKNNVVTAWQ